MNDTQPHKFSCAPHCTDHTVCVFCRKSIPQLNVTQNELNRFGQEFVFCSVMCRDILTRVSCAFIQGFLIGCVIHFCCKKWDTESKCDSDAFCGHNPQQNIACKNELSPAVGKDSNEISSGRSSCERSLLLPKTQCKSPDQFERERYITMPVHFGTDLYLPENLDYQMKNASMETEIISQLSEKRDPKSSSVNSLLFDGINKRSVSICPSSLDQLSCENRSDGFQTVKSTGLGQNTCRKETDPLQKRNSAVIIYSNSLLQSSQKKESCVLNAKKADVQGQLTIGGDAQGKLNADGDMLISSANTQKQCSYCNKRFRNKQLLSYHEKSHHPRKNNTSTFSAQQNFTCEFCAQIFMNRYSLKAHIRRKHSGEEPVACDICGKVQPGSFALSSHKKACHDFSSLCHVCGASFSGRTSFDKHMASHRGVKCFFCDICGAGFVHNSSLNNHKAVHVTTKSFQCDICSQMFKVQYLLNEHLLKSHQCGPSLEHRIRGLKKMGFEVDREAISRHTNGQCIICGERLVDRVCPSHPAASQEVFHCPTCGDMTSNIVLFYQHVKWHKGTLSSHSRRTSVQADAPVGVRLSASTSTPSSSVIKCEVCSKTFNNFEYLSAHMHQHREARFVCDICNKRFTYKCNLKTHMNTHLDTWQFECEVCQKKFRDKYAFKKHQVKHRDPQFKCEICEKALTRKSYLMKHYQKMHPEHQQGM